MTVISGTTGIDKVQDGSIHEVDINADVARLGEGQVWHNVTGSRVLGTTYTNTTGKAIVVHIRCSISSAAAVELTINGVLVPGNAYGSATSNTTVVSAIVPNNSTYVTNSSQLTLGTWVELR